MYMYFPLHMTIASCPRNFCSSAFTQRIYNVLCMYMNMYMYIHAVYVCMIPAASPSPAAPRVSDPQLRDSVDFGELLERPEEREEDRQRK